MGDVVEREEFERLRKAIVESTINVAAAINALRFQLNYLYHSGKFEFETARDSDQFHKLFEDLNMRANMLADNIEEMGGERRFFVT